MSLNVMGKVALVIGIVVSAVMLTIYVTGNIMSSTAEFRGEVGKKEKVVADPDYRIAAYDEFYDLCSAVQAKNDEIGNLEVASESATGERKEQLDGAILAQQNSKAELVREYNSKAAAEGTRGQFRDSELPYQIDPQDEEVSCGS